MTAKISFFGLVVDDMARSLAFYRQLGFDIPASEDGEPHVEVELAGGLRLAWDTVDTVRSFDPGWTAPSGSHRVAIAVGCDDAAGVDSLYQKLGELGYHQYKEPWDAFWGQRYATVHDPDGNGVDLFAPLPAE
jgi:uncharacterized glyoxalase superfamily protein PhnB